MTVRASKLSVAFVVAALVSTSTPARAQPGPPATPQAPAAASSQSAEELAALAFDQQAAGKYAEAVGSYIAAYYLSNASVILFNVATIYDRKLHEGELASEYYRRYLEAPQADPDLARKATARLEELKQEKTRQADRVVAVSPAPTIAAAPPASVAGPPAMTEPQAERWGPTRTSAVVLGGAGLAALGATLVLSVVAKNDNSDANAYCVGNACSDARGVSDARDAGSLAAAATVTVISGAVLLAAGVGLWFLAPTKHPSGKPSAQDDRVRVFRHDGTTVLGLAF